MTGAAPDVVVGGGVAGIAAALALAEAGSRVVLIERRGGLGGRASSFRDASGIDDVDWGQHVLLGCCTNAIDLLRGNGTLDLVDWHDTFHYLEPGGARHDLAPSRLPAPMHYLPSLRRFGALTVRERRAVIAAFRWIATSSRARFRRETAGTMGDWLRRRGQPEGAVRRFWEPIVVGAVNETADRAAARACLLVFVQGFMAHRRAPLLGVPRRGLSELFGAPALDRLRGQGHDVRLRTRVDAVECESGRAVAVRLAGGERLPCSRLVLAIPAHALLELPFENAPPPIAPEHLRAVEHAPILGLDLVLDRRVLDLPHAALLDSELHWIFDRRTAFAGAGQRLALIVSAAHALMRVSKSDLEARTLRELARFLPAAEGARILRATVVKDGRATITLTPEVEALRPPSATRLGSCFLAGDWTAVGWPSTIEGSIRSGRRAAALAAGRPDLGPRPDLERGALARLLLRGATFDG